MDLKTPIFISVDEFVKEARSQLKRCIGTGRTLFVDKTTESEYIAFTKEACKEIEAVILPPERYLDLLDHFYTYSQLSSELKSLSEGMVDFLRGDIRDFSDYNGAKSNLFASSEFSVNITASAQTAVGALIAGTYWDEYSPDDKRRVRESIIDQIITLYEDPYKYPVSYHSQFLPFEIRCCESSTPYDIVMYTVFEETNSVLVVNVFRELLNSLQEKSVVENV